MVLGVGANVFDRLLRDAEHFEKRLGAIDGAGDTGAYLVGLAREKNVAAPAPATTAPPSSASPVPTTPSAHQADGQAVPTAPSRVASNDDANTVQRETSPVLTADAKGNEEAVKVGGPASRGEEES
jgi:hypothetical protein